MSNTQSQTNGSLGMALVTGGSRGIGAAICRRLAADGYAVAVGYASGRDGANATVEAIRAAGGTAEAFQADLGEPESIAGLFEAAVSALGPLSLLVANAGMIGERARLDEQSLDNMARVLRVNALAPMLCAQDAVKRLSTRHGGPGGSIIVISSVAARLGGAGGLVSYATSKGAMETFIKGLAKEVAAEGIRVNAVAPGVIDTDMPPPELRENIDQIAPMARLGKPEEIADAVAWLASDQSAFVTGESITVSGGR